MRKNHVSVRGSSWLTAAKYDDCQVGGKYINPLEMICNLCEMFSIEDIKK